MEKPSKAHKSNSSEYKKKGSMGEEIELPNDWRTSRRKYDEK